MRSLYPRWSRLDAQEESTVSILREDIQIWSFLAFALSLPGGLPFVPRPQSAICVRNVDSEKSCSSQAQVNGPLGGQEYLSRWFLNLSFRPFSYPQEHI